MTLRFNDLNDLSICFTNDNSFFVNILKCARMLLVSLVSMMIGTTSNIFRFVVSIAHES